MHTMRGWACWSLSLVLCITALCLHTVHAADPVTLHRVVSSELGCASSAGLEDVTSEAQCQLFAADVQCPGNEGNETATYGGPGESYLPIGCVCNHKSVYYISRSRSQHSQQIRVDSCSRLYPCVFQFVPALGVNCTQGTFSNTTSNQAIRCTVNSTTCTPLPSTTPTVVVPSSSSRRNFYKGDCDLTAAVVGGMFLWFLLGLLWLGVQSKFTWAPFRGPPSSGAPQDSPNATAQFGNHVSSPGAPAMPAHPSTCPPQPVENELAAGWQAVVDPSSGQTYYQNHATHATQWRKPTAEDGMVGGLSFGQVVVDVNGGAFGILPGIPGMGNMQNRMMRQASLAMGSGQKQPGGPGDQSNNPTQEFEEDASSWDKAQAVLSFGYALGERALFIVLSVLKGGSFTLFLFLIDVLLLGFYGHRGVYEDKARYCPGCLYNDLHVLIKGKKLKGIFVSLKTKRFSGTKKFIVGMAALATITQVVENVSDNWCILQDFEGFFVKNQKLYNMYET